MNRFGTGKWNGGEFIVRRYRDGRIEAFERIFPAGANGNALQTEPYGGRCRWVMIMLNAIRDVGEGRFSNQLRGLVKLGDKSGCAGAFEDGYRFVGEIVTEDGTYRWRVLWSEICESFTVEALRYVIRDGRGLWLPLAKVTGHSGFGGNNLAPSTIQPILIEHRDGTRLAESMRWGLLRPWSKRGYPIPIEARSETIAEKPIFRDLVPRKRCIVTMDGYFEWKKEGRGKTPYHIYPTGERRIRAAGLYDQWSRPDGTIDASYCLVTTPATSSIARINDRMPVILQSDAEEDIWLSPLVTDHRAIRELMRPCPPEWLDAYPVRNLVNNWRNQGPEILEPRFSHLTQLSLPI